ncbi:Caf20 protein [Saccharomycopsis crataegensis]|uniref:Cap-associated protein CAF20 n=1 Tax=Saccharomycopsis crataegensis TaxID=43959 RepID=A0AAV5QQD7_9ASCO|nr:Caf20 protein [Saccharomycopsis crataegensis]
MAKYTEEELLSFRDHGAAPQGVDLKAFSDMIADVKEKLAQKYEAENQEGKFTFSRRRSSRHDARPHFKKNFRKHEHVVQPDAEGWVTLKNTRKSFGAGNEESRDEFREAVKIVAPVMKVKPNTKGIGTRAAADTKEAVSEKKTKKFNAFSALGSDDEEEEEEDEEDEDEEEDEEDEEEEEEEE